MNIAELPFDTEQMIAGLALWVETESPGFSAAAVNRVNDLAAYDLASIGATIQRIPGRIGYADTLRATVNPDAGDKPGILICCHTDTVHECGSIAAMPYRREGNHLWGAGIAAMKAGIYICLEALRQLVRNDVAMNLPVTVIFIPDKESGCPSTRELFEATAARNKYVLVPDCASDRHCVYNGCYAQDRYKLDVKVDSVSEAGFSESAITEMARHIVAVDELSTNDCQFKTGAIKSGQWANFAEKCTAEVIVEAHTEKAVADGRQRMMALNSPNPDKGLHVNRDVSLPLWLPAADSNQLLDIAKQVAGLQGIELQASVGAGGSLAGITGSTGIATLGGLGPVGAGARSRSERIEIDSLTVRAALMAALLQTLT